MKYYKVLRKNKVHKGFKYQKGLNVDTVPFNPDIYMPGGLHFASRDILAFVCHGPWLAEVTIPENAQVYQNLAYNPEVRKADCIFLGNCRRITAKVLQDLITEGANLHVLGDHALRWFAQNGRVEMVQVLLANGADVHSGEEYALRAALANGHDECASILLAAGANPNFDKHLDYNFDNRHS
jgi:hypothetical protein